jgi:hypothetical protein
MGCQGSGRGQQRAGMTGNGLRKELRLSDGRRCLPHPAARGPSLCIGAHRVPCLALKR